MRQMELVGAAEDRLAEANRRTMVKPAPAGFTPEPVDRKVRLRLVLEKSKIRVGERPRFRLEMTNIGREPIEYFESRSSLFVKDGGLLDTLTMEMHLSDGRNKRIRLLPPPLGSSEGLPPKKREGNALSQAEQARRFDEINSEGQARATFRVLLNPGDTLHSVGDDDSPVDNFKTLRTKQKFDVPGAYQLEVTLDDRPMPLDEEFINTLMRAGESREKIMNTYAERVKAALGPASARAALEVVR